MDSGVADTASEDGRSISRASKKTSSDLQTLRDPSHYEELNVIGNGAYGTVYRARDKTTDTIVALKKMRFSLTEDGVPMANAENERCHFIWCLSMYTKISPHTSKSVHHQGCLKIESSTSFGKYSVGWISYTVTE